MKKNKLSLKDYADIIIASIGAAVFIFTIISCMAWRAKEYDKRMIQEEYNKKTDTSRTYISQN